MAKNIEIKARVDDLSSVYERAKQISDHGPDEIYQHDTFFSCQNGRLKLRRLSEEEGQLIFYQRPDQGGPKESFYVISPTTSPTTLGESLALAYGVVGKVKKKRILFCAGRTRIHLDIVEGLGNFVELEVVLREGERAEQGVKEAQQLMLELGIKTSGLIEGAYVDMIAQKSSH